MSSVSTDHDGLEGIKVGDVYCEEFVKRLPGGVDLMGENGEFHTHVYHNDKAGKTREEEHDDEHGDELDDDELDDESDSE